jgi:hypothetical protein
MGSGSASDLLSLCAERARTDISSGTEWAKNPRALAGRLRRAQTFLRTLGIEITFSREGRTGTRMIRVSTSAKNSVSTVSTVSAARSRGSRGDQRQPCWPQRVNIGRADAADGTDANRTFCFGRLPSAGRNSTPPDFERLARMPCPGPRWFGTEQSRRLATLDAAPEFLLRRQKKVLIERIG